jgi:hypothetical protein
MASNRRQLMQKAHNPSAILPTYSADSRYAVAALDLRHMALLGSTLTEVRYLANRLGDLVCGISDSGISGIRGTFRKFGSFVLSVWHMVVVLDSRSIMRRNGKATISGTELTGSGKGQENPQPIENTAATLAGLTKRNKMGNPDGMPAFPTENRFHASERYRERGSEIRH